jgi:pimeloyl-ACP methyl ester carboxylesterase
MSYADNRGIRIHYRVEGEGPPLVLQHGFTQSIDDWYEAGYVEAHQMLSMHCLANVKNASLAIFIRPATRTFSAERGPMSN